jgi:folate-binding protein YgfZ
MNSIIYTAARESAVWRDMSHFGRFRVSGADAAALLHHLTTNDVKRLKVGEGSDAVLVNNKARTLDIVTVLRNANDFLVITSPNRRPMFAPHAQKFVLFRQDIKIEDVSERGALFGVFGPEAAATLKDQGLPAPETQNAPQQAELGGVALHIAQTSRLPGGGFLIWSHEGKLPANLSTKPRCDNETYNILRVEAGIPVAGLEITEDVNPWEAGLSSMISLHKGCYNGQEVIARLNTYNKVKQQLLGLKLERTFPMGERAALKADGKDAGFVTSSVVSPEHGPIGLGFVRGVWTEAGTTLEVMLGDDAQKAEVTSLPFN